MIRKPKNHNRIFLVEIGTEALSEIVPVAAGITSHGSNISESTEKYYYMDQRGTSETDVTGQDVSRSFSGHRVKGDAAQDYILDKLLYDTTNRVVTFYDYDDGAVGSPNGWKGEATLQITDDGSGDAATRQNIAFTLMLNGKPERGTVTKAVNPSTGVITYTWMSKT